MVNLNKTISLAVAAFGVSLGFALPELAVGQAGSALAGINSTADLFDRDPLPLATPYRAKSDEPQEFVVDVPAGVKEANNAAPIPVPAVIANFLKPEVDAKPVSVATILKPKPVQSAPTVIIRPSVDGSNQLTDLTVEINKIADRPGNEYVIKVTVPDSVRVVELVPVQDENLQQDFEIQMEQNPESNAVDSIAESLMPMKTSLRVPARMASNPNVAVNQPTTHRQNSIQTGYKTNPFYGKPGFPASDPTIVRNETQLPHAVQETSWPNKTRLPNVPPKLVSFRKPSTVSVTAPVSQPNPKPPLASLRGPQSMGLGDIGDFQVYVLNQNSSTASNLSVQLEVPPGLDIVVVDRAAAVDQSNGTLTWQLPDAKPGEEHLIRYRVKSLAEGTQRQRLKVSSQDGQFSTEFGTDVQLKDSSEAPLLPFDSH